MKSLIAYINNKNKVYILDKRFDIKKDKDMVFIDFDNSIDKNFYNDKVSSVRFIVGANGTGKTTTIIEYMNQLMKANVAIKIYLTDKDELEIYVKELSNVKVKTKLTHSIANQLAEENIIFSSSSLEPFKSLDESIHNISTSEYLLENSYNEMLNRDMIQQVEYCLNSDKKIEIINWNNKVIKEVISYEGQNIQKVTSFLLSKIKFKNFNFDKYSRLEKFNVSIFEKKRNAVLTAKFISMLISNIEINKWNSFKKTMDDKNEDFSVLIQNISELLPDTFDFEGLKESFNELLRFEAGKEYKLKNLNDEKVLKKLINEVNKNALSTELSSVLRLEWKSISYGEYNLLNLFGRYYSLMNKVNIIEGQPIILFIDEIDIGIHPEWQINLMNILFHELPKIFKCKIQLFMTTHSPLLLSDILDRDIIFYEEYQKESKEKILTFGQNVQTLLTSAFFLNKTIGVFSQKKINKISNIVSDPYII
ncbi:MAG: AAA family ATPase [Vagococcus salmoninarum]|uniref:AAA family ATPase n=2 Tax=Vagococcus salmoninarum TaxID=2739 RepID=UPI003F9978AD